MMQNGGMITEAESLSEQEKAGSSAQVKKLTSDRKEIYPPPLQEISQSTGSMCRWVAMIPW